MRGLRQIARRARVGAMAVWFVVAAGLIACGGSPKEEPPPAAARQAVTTFVAALGHRDGEAACRVVADELVADLRTLALGNFRPSAATAAERLAQVKRANAGSRTCAGALGLLARDLGAKQRAALAAGARSLPMTWLGGQAGAHVRLGDEDWVVERRGEGWRVSTANAVADALT